MAVQAVTAGASRAQEFGQAALLLAQAEHAIAQRLARVLGDCSIERWRTLMLLEDGAGHSMTEIAAFALVPPPTLTRLIDAMVSDNLVYRKVDLNDRRRALVFASDRGHQLRRDLSGRIEREIATAMPERVLSDLGELTSLLATLLQRLG